MIYFILIVMAILGIYFAFRYISLLYAFRKMKQEMCDIQKDLTQNQMLHMPVPDRHLAEVVRAFNITLEGIQKERQKYEKREKEFQKQIENISHDLRTPLTVILGYLKFIKNKPHMTQDKELKETIEVIEYKAETMKNLVAQFYEFSRLNAGDYKLKLDRVDISRILRESLAGNYQVLQQSDLNVSADIPEHPVWILGETAALERVFLNLMQNAGRYADTCLNIRVQENAENVSVFFVNDTKSLFEEDISHLFDRFYMGDHSRNQGGTGLGLTVAKSLAEEMGGALSVHMDRSGLSEQEDSRMMLCFELRYKVFSFFEPPC
ncbi:HAMP domain-containing histidine kinase [Frisingicoccus caecimuris]|uniref:histidine kinase n=1 Tax=Frisingicoccus caecimuris TaxID=1796636 RepID=A0A4R2LD69_9FIRM|nr:HAMP domain-containing sensor histidine kinase [Frisingicoccus caecimuris]MCR1917550.1 HAMP domain-containing histidine kinase [Frisingicoccus caecimuris]TCO85820.1 signal transduction histidine kinase [Frisingicoccus caecimuris]